MEERMNLKFVDYYKYVFSFKDDTGKIWTTGGDSGDIYRFSVDAENVAFKMDGMWILDGMLLTPTGEKG